MSPNTNILTRFIPEAAAPIVAKWIDHLQVELKITKPRETVLGDYRHPFGNSGHRISVNANLNPYAFLITLIHEFAHLIVWNKYRNKVRPHGEHWKEEYKRLMKPFLEMQIFPDKIQAALLRYMNNPAASSCSDDNLQRVLKQYDTVQNTVFVSALPAGALFQMKNGRVFRKGQLIRKRYKCKEMPNGHDYLFSSTAEVYSVTSPES